MENTVEQIKYILNTHTCNEKVYIKCSHCDKDSLKSYRYIRERFKESTDGVVKLFCCQKCYFDNKTSLFNIEVSCENCGKSTNNPKFCSRSCSASYNNRKSSKRVSTKTCRICNDKPMSTRSVFCEKHYEEWKISKRSITIDDYQKNCSAKGKHPSWKNVKIRSLARTWLSHLKEMPCAKCGYNLHVELAHIKAISEFSGDTQLSVVNSEKNVIQLCPNCHWEFDNLPRDGIFTSLLKDLDKNLE